MTLSTLLLIVALVLFIAAAFNIDSPVNLLAAGLAFFVGAVIIGSSIG